MQICSSVYSQMKRARRCQKKLRTILSRAIRDIERKCTQPDENSENLMTIAKRIHAQQRLDKNKVYSVHEPQVA